MQDLDVMDKDKEWSIKFTDIPLGIWDIYGHWQPNLNLEMSISDQIRHNIIGGHFKKIYPPTELIIRLTSVEDPSLWEKACIWIRERF